MITVFKSDDPMIGEVYHHIKDVSGFLEYTVDILHRIVVRRI